MKKKQKKFLYKLGLVFLICSLLIWIIPVITPFMPLSMKVKAGIITGSIVLAEVMFWIGALFVGKEVSAKFKGYLYPRNWRKKGAEQEQE